MIQTLRKPAPARTALTGAVRIPGLALLLVVAGCASAPKVPPARPAPATEQLRKLGGGDAIVIQRPTPNWARLSLWLPVGSRHAEVPALATVAARWAATHAGAESRVLPDATEIALDCDLEQRRLARCVRDLVSALAPPAPKDADVGAMRRRLTREVARRDATAGSNLDLAALGALMGEETVASWDPLAGATDGAIDAGAVQRFIRDHYGANRALLIAAGDVSEDALAGWSDGLPSARSSQTAPPALTPSNGVRVVEGARAAVVLALSAPSLEAARALARAFQVPHPGSGASAFAVGERALLVLRVPVVGKPWGELRSAAFDALRLSVEGDTGASTRGSPPPQDLTSLTRRTGEAWVHRTVAGSTESPWPLGAVVSFPGLSPVAPSAEGDVAALRQRIQDEAEATVAAARAQLSPRTRGRADPDRAEVTLDNGLVIEVQRRAQDETYAASVEVMGGATLDPPGQHGRAAHLAMLASSACAFASRPALSDALQREGARMGPLVSARKWGVLAQGAASDWRLGVDRLLRCVVRPSFRGRDIEDARVALLSALGEVPGAQHAWAAAQTLSPEAPGVLAPWGSPQGVAAVGVGGLRSLHASSLRGQGVRVRLRVPAAADEAARFVARRLAQVRAGQPPEWPNPQPAPPGELRGVEMSAQAGVRAWIGLAHAQPFEGDGAIAALAEQVGYRLDALPGYTLRGVAGGGLPYAWLWLELVVTDPDRLDELPAALDAALRAVKSELPQVVDAQVAAARQRRRSAASDPAQELRRLFVAPERADEDARKLRGLLDAAPRFVVAHPAD